MLSYGWYFHFVELQHTGYAYHLPTFFSYVQKTKTSNFCIFIFAKIFSTKQQELFPTLMICSQFSLLVSWASHWHRHLCGKKFYLLHIATYPFVFVDEDLPVHENISISICLHMAPRRTGTINKLQVSTKPPASCWSDFSQECNWKRLVPNHFSLSSSAACMCQLLAHLFCTSNPGYSHIYSHFWCFLPHTHTWGACKGEFEFIHFTYTFYLLYTHPGISKNLGAFIGISQEFLGLCHFYVSQHM